MSSKNVSRTVKLYIDNQEIDGSVKSIKSRIRELTAEMNKLTVGTKEYEERAKKIRELNGILAEHRRNIKAVADETNTLSSRFGKIADGFNRYMGVIGGAIASITGLTMTIRKSVQDFADMEEAEAQVRKYTGMTAEQVKELNEELKALDTRTSREELNALAGEAGRLGITSKDAIMEFVDGADKIRVALGDDLGETAVRDIGKLAQMFGEDKKRGLRGAMLATGSAVNELAQNSSAGADAIVQFTARLAGVAQQAGLTQAEIMGIGSVMSQNMQEIPTSATVISQLITKMMQDTGRFAKLAGQDVEEFSNLLRTDANKALVTFLNAMKQRGGFQDMAKMFDEMKMDGTRAVGVLSALAGHLDQLSEAQSLANNAYAEGTSVINEFNVQNNTVQAQLDKAKKQFHEISVELGEKLMPIARYGITTGSAMVKILSRLITFVSQHRVTLIALAATLAISNARQLYAISLAKLQVFWNEKLIVSFKALATAIKANPWGVAIAAITTLMALLIDAAAKHDEEVQKMDAVSRAHKRASEQYEEESSKVQALIEMVNNSNNSYELRKAKLDELKSIVPGYHADLTKEGKLINNNTEALKRYLENLERSIKLKAAQEDLEAAYRKKRNLEKQRGTLQEQESEDALSLTAAQWSANSTANKLGTKGMQTISRGTDIATKQAQDRLTKTRQQLSETNKAISETQKDIDDLNKEITTASKGLAVSAAPEAPTPAPIAPTSGGSGSNGKKGRGGSTEEKLRKEVRAELLKIDAEYTAKQNELREQFVKGEIASTEELNAKIQELELERLKKELEVANLEPAKREEVAKKILDMRVKLKDELDNILEEMNEYEDESYEKQLKKLEENLRKQETVLKRSLDNQLITQEQYAEQLEKIRSMNDAQQAKVREEEAEKQFALMDKVHEQKLIALERNHYEQLTSEEEFEKNKRAAEKEFLQQALDTLELSAEKRQELQNEIDNFELEKAKEKYDKQLAQLNNIFNSMQDVAQKFGEEWGTMMQTFFDSGELQLGEFLKSLLKLTLDALEKTVIMAVAERTVKNIASLGLAGMAKAALEIAAITAAFETAKAAIMSFDTGGFTGAGAWNEPKGIVHANEFVANRYATNNPNILPVLNLIDQAQRVGSVANLSSQDIAAVLPTSSNGITRRSSSTAAAATADNTAMLTTLASLISATQRLSSRLDEPILAETYVTGKRGINEAQSLADKMRSNVSRN